MGGRRMRGDESLRSVVERVVRAIEDEGSVPRWHRDIMRRQRAEWPALWRELDRLRLAHRATQSLPPPRREEQAAMIVDSDWLVAASEDYVEGEGDGDVHR
jgi:hypothetical protein